MKAQTDWNLFFSRSPTRSAICCPAQQKFPIRIHGTGDFFWGRPTQNANSYPAREKTPVRLEVDRTHFFREALGKTQISGRRNKTFRSRFMEPETFFGGKPYAKCKFLSGARKKSGPLRSGPDTFFGGSLKQNANFRCQHPFGPYNI